MQTLRGACMTLGTRCTVALLLSSKQQWCLVFLMRWGTACDSHRRIATAVAKWRPSSAGQVTSHRGTQTSRRTLPSSCPVANDGHSATQMCLLPCAAAPPTSTGVATAAVAATPATDFTFLLFSLFFFLSHFFFSFSKRHHLLALFFFFSSKET